MNRRFLAGVAALAVVVAVASPAFAGGGGGSKSKVNIRVKNFTSSVASVAVANRNPRNFRSLSPTQVTQFKVNKGAYQVDDGGGVTGFNTGSAKTRYIALTDFGPEQTSTKF
jgi:hypothetical protein